MEGPRFNTAGGRPRARGSFCGKKEKMYPLLLTSTAVGVDRLRSAQLGGCKLWRTPAAVLQGVRSSSYAQETELEYDIALS